jgi:hypothetical protein
LTAGHCMKVGLSNAYHPAMHTDSLPALTYIDRWQLILTFSYCIQHQRQMMVEFLGAVTSIAGLVDVSAKVAMTLQSGSSHWFSRARNPSSRSFHQIDLWRLGPSLHNLVIG